MTQITDKVKIEGKFGFLTVIEEMPKGFKDDDARYVRCICDCGKEKIINGYNVLNGGTISCGCRRKALKKYSEKTMGTPEYRTWLGIKARCHNPKNKNYARYGGRGITVSDNWVNNFSQFLADMGKRPSKAHSLERVNNDKGYSKENCIWLEMLLQGRNRRNTPRVQYLGETITLKELSERLGFSYNLVKERLDNGWDLQDAINKPSRKSKNLDDKNNFALIEKEIDDR